VGGNYIQPTILKGHNKMRVFQEEIFGPVVSVTTFKDEAEALAIANDTMYGLGAGVWSRDANTCYRFGRAIEAGRVWVNNYHAYPTHAAFGGYKQSGIGRETHKMMLDHYQQTKNILMSYNPKKLGFFWGKLGRGHWPLPHLYKLRRTRPLRQTMVASVAARMSSWLTPGAVSRMWRPLRPTSSTPRLVMIRSTTPLPVSGRVHSCSTLLSPCLLV